MAEPVSKPESVEGMAFQLLLQKMTDMEATLHALPPLLQKIVDHLEAQHTQPDVPVASYADLYPGFQGAAGPEVPEASETSEFPGPPSPQAPPVPGETPPQRRRWWHWFLREG